MATTFPTEHEVALRDGTTVQIRPLRRDDELAFADFLAGLSLRSLAFRFFTAGVSPDVAARRSVDLHYPDSFALYRYLRDYLYQRDFQVAARPIPHGHPIGFGPQGTASQSQ